LWTALSEGGEEGPCGWLKDRYALSWQSCRIAELERAYAAGA
jgi:predicted 3-demethylubiquinone-9 3-methyltransferase (glyoxalase superfamily)